MQTYNEGSLSVLKGGASIRAVAAGAGDATQATGPGVDRMPTAGQDGYDFAVIEILGSATLADTKTLTLATTLQESSDNSVWDTEEVIQAATLVATGQSGGTTEEVSHELKVDLRGRKQFVRARVTPDLNAASIDTATLGYGWKLNNARVAPAV